MEKPDKLELMRAITVLKLEYNERLRMIRDNIQNVGGNELVSGMCDGINKELGFFIGEFENIKKSLAEQED